MDNIVKLCDEENRKFWFGISKVDRYQDEEDDPWWNVRVVYKNHWVDYDENSESMTELELKAIANEIEKRFIKKVRDKYLCKGCITGKYSTCYRYTYNDLEVHHIVPIKEDYSKRLDSENLITLCRMHHEMAEKGEISRDELKELIK